MNTLRVPLFLTLFTAFCCITSASTAKAGPDADASSSPTSPPAASRELAIVIVEPLGKTSGSSTPFHYLKASFHDLAKARKWPVTLTVERLGGNTPDYPTELRLFHKSIHREVGDRLTMRTWATLTDQGKEHDFGVVTVHYDPRPGEATEDTIEKLYRRMTEAIAAKIEPLLFPKS